MAEQKSQIQPLVVYQEPSYMTVVMPQEYFQSLQTLGGMQIPGNPNMWRISVVHLRFIWKIMKNYPGAVLDVPSHLLLFLTELDKFEAKLTELEMNIKTLAQYSHTHIQTTQK